MAGFPSIQASDGVLYISYGALLVSGLAISYIYQQKGQFVSGNGTQRALPLALNFVASAMGSGILTTYPQIAAISGVQGLIVYGVSSALPIMLFAFAGPAIRKRCPNGFVLTEWVRHRYGILAQLYLSAFTILTMFLYMVAELGAVQLAIESMTGLNALPFMIIECIVTTIYTTWGGFHTSFITDNLQGAAVFLLLIVCSIAMGTQIDIDTSTIGPSGLLKGSTLGYQLIYILPVAIATNDCFLSGFWLRTFASRTDKDLYIACIVATIITLVFLIVIGVTGLLAVWGNLIDMADLADDSANAFFLVVLQLPAWVVGFVLVFTVTLSTAAFDSLQSAMASSISNDIFRNKIPVLYVRLIVILLMAPSLAVAIQAPNILRVYLISDLISAAVVPVMFLGLSNKFFFITGWEVIVSGIGGILSVFIFGAIYYHNAADGAGLMILVNGLYVDDWSAFGAFVVAPFGGLVFGAITLVIRLLVLKVHSRITGAPFTALQKPAYLDTIFEASVPTETEDALTESLASPFKALKNKISQSSKTVDASASEVSA